MPDVLGLFQQYKDDVYRLALSYTRNPQEADKDGREAYLAVGGTPQCHGQYTYYPHVSDQVVHFEGYTSTDDPTPAWVTDARNQIRNLMG